MGEEKRRELNVEWEKNQKERYELSGNRGRREGRTGRTSAQDEHHVGGALTKD